MKESDLHIGCINIITWILRNDLPKEYLYSIQNAVQINTFSAPEPDVSVLHFRQDFYSTGKAQPYDILLLIEVADTTVSSDRQIKIPLYVRAGVPEVWLINLPRKIIEVYTEPKNGKYQIVRKAGRTEILQPLLIKDLSVKVTDILS